MDHRIGTVFVELDLDKTRYMKAQQQLYKDATSTSLSIEENFKKLGIKTSAEFDLMRAKISNAYNSIAHDARATANDRLRAEKAMHEQLEKINEQQFGSIRNNIERQKPLITSLKDHWLAATAIIAGSVYTISRAWSMVKMGAEYDEQSGILDNLGKKYNLTADSIVSSMQMASDNLIAKTDLMTVALGGLAKGLNPRQLTNLADAATILSDAVGKDATTALQDLTQALETGRTKGLKNYLGTAIDLEATFGDLYYKLTEAEKAQALYNLTMISATELQEQQARVVDKTADDIERVEAKYKDATLAASRFFKSVIADLYGYLSSSVWEDYGKKSNYGYSNVAKINIKQEDPTAEYKAQIDALRKALEDRSVAKKNANNKLGKGATKAGEPLWLTPEEVDAREAYNDFMGYGLTNNIDASRESGFTDYSAYVQDTVNTTTSIYEKASNDWIDLSERTADAVEQNFSDFWFDAMRGELDDLGDYVNSFFTSIQRSAADVMGQMTKEFFFGNAAAGTGSMFGAFLQATFNGGALTTMADGGTINEPIYGMGKSGRKYLFGEGGEPEDVTPRSKQKSSPGGSITQNLNVTIVAADSKSFVDMANRNPDAVIGPFISALNKGNQAVISAIRRVS